MLDGITTELDEAYVSQGVEEGWLFETGYYRDSTGVLTFTYSLLP